MRRDLREDVPALTPAGAPGRGETAGPAAGPVAAAGPGRAESPGLAPGPGLAEARRRLLVDAIGVVLSVFAFGVVYGLAARAAGLSILEATAMSVFVFAGASQFVAAGLIAQATPWPAIVVLTALLNARHLLYAAGLVPWLRGRPARERAAIAYGITDEAFALSAHHFARLGRVDPPGFWIAALCVWVPWNVATVVGVVGGQAIPDPTRFGLDVVFPATMAGLATLLIRSRGDLVAAVVGAGVAVALALALDPSVGIIAGGLVGPLVSMRVGGRGPGDRAADEEAELERIDATVGIAP